jgi:glycosyltransferase involved in cell wall biosynthesis
VITSESEGLPLAALEALSMGNAVVSTDVGEVARVVRDGEAGFVVPAVGDTEAFRERLLEYLHRPGLLEAHRARARRLVETAHSSETMGEAYLRTFGLAGPPRASRRA